MALTPRLDLRQVQTLVMTPQLQQAIKLLQLSNLELAEFVEQELEQNPLLQREDQSSEPQEPGDGAAPSNDAGDDAYEDSPDYGAAEYSETETGVSDFGDGGDLPPDPNDPPDAPDSVDLVNADNIPEEGDSALDAEYDDVWAQESASDSAADMEGESLHWQVQGSGGFDLDDNSMDRTPADQESLRDHLSAQIAFDIPDPAERIIANTLIDLLDDSGYLLTPLTEIAAGLGCGEDRVEAVLEKIHRLDPPGIGARNLAECLAIQLRERDRFDPAMQALVENLDLLAKRDFKTLLRKCEVDQEDLAEMIDEIRALDPKPALSFEETVTQPVTPDVMVRRGRDGTWLVELNSDNLPRVLINNRYYAEVSKATTSKKDKEYISSCYQSANWLMRALHQRAQTILKVSSEIVRHQEGFLEHGVDQLKPLILRDIAGILGIHESTVSRVTTNKYMATPRGMFELKYFFTFALGNPQDEDAMSVEAIRARIKKMIENESPNKVLSDDKIVAQLKEDGIEIARRTVAKYREGMKIPSSVQRRREKSMLADTA